MDHFAHFMTAISMHKIPEVEKETLCELCETV